MTNPGIILDEIAIQELKEARTLHEYTDGSCMDNQNNSRATTAGWGFVASFSQHRPHEYPIVEMWGKVITDPNSNKWIGADIGSNNTG